MRAKTFAASIVAAVAAVSAWAGLARPAAAIPVVFTPAIYVNGVATETPPTFSLTLFAGHLATSGSVQGGDPFQHWDITNLVTSWSNNSANAVPSSDVVQVTGTALHTNNMPDDGLHDDAVQFNFAFSLTNIINLTPTGGGGTVGHPPHSDAYSLSAQVERDPANRNDFLRWEVTITGTHVPRAVPEPATVIVLAIGLAGLFAFKVRQEPLTREKP